MGRLKYLLYALSLPADLLCWGWLCIVRLLWGQRLQFKRGVLAVEIKEGSWPNRTWYRGWGATTLGHGMMFNSGYLDDEEIWDHELVHVEQFESEGVQAAMLVIAAVVANAPWWLYAILAVHGFTNYAASLITAKLRGEPDAYMGSHLEEAAYAHGCCKRLGLR